MEDADKVSSSAPEELLGKESDAARGESRSRDEKTLSPHTNEDNSTPPITEENVSPHITKENITSEITEENITAQTKEENVTPHITEEHIYSQVTEENITRQIQNENVTPSITEESCITTTEIRVTPQESEIARSSQRTAQSVAREGPEGSLQDSEVSCVSQKTEATSSAVSEATCVSQTAAEVSSLITVSSAQTRHTTDLTPEDIPEKKPSLHPFSSSYKLVPVPAPTPQFSTDLRHSSAVVSQESGANLTMESFRQNSAEIDPDVLNQTSEEDFQFEMKNCSFHPFSTVRDAVRSVVSVSSSPDLVQGAYDGDDDVTEPQEIKVLFDSEAVTSRSHLEQLDSSDLFSKVNKEGDDRPTSLPDILKSSPLNPDKVDSGSSEGSPDLSPAHRSGSDSPNSPISVSANIPLEFDSKILLLKEMTEVTEAKGVETANLDPEKIPEQSFDAFDLVKETDVAPKSERPLKDKDAETSVQMNDKFECLHFPTEKALENSDSESPSADSFSPVLDAVAKRPMEDENTDDKEEIEAIDEVSEQEVSSEEFEFVERPTRDAADEFLEIQDSETFYEEQSPGLEQSSAGHAEDQSSYHLLSQLSEDSSPVRGKTGLETAFKASLIHTPADQNGLEKTEVSSLSSVRAASVLDVVYWRDLKWSAVVFSFSLLLLLSLTCCSVVSVMAYTTLALLSLTVAFRIYKAILQAIQKSDKGHPFKHYLDIDVALSTDVVQKYSDVALRRIIGGLTELRRLFLVEDLVDSLKFAVFLWILTYVGAVFNGLTLVILGLVGAFSGPVIYEQHQAQIDASVSMVKNQMKDFWGKIQAKVPGMKK